MDGLRSRLLCGARVDQRAERGAELAQLRGLAVAEQLFMIEGCAPVGPVVDDDHFEGGRVSRTKPSTMASPPAFSGAARHSGHAGGP